MSQPIHWLQSQRFIALCQSSAYLIVAWLIMALSSNTWDWKLLAVTVLGNVLLAINDWKNPNVQAPFAILNRNNTSTVPASSVRDAEKQGEP